MTIMIWRIIVWIMLSAALAWAFYDCHLPGPASVTFGMCAGIVATSIVLPPPRG